MYKCNIWKTVVYYNECMILFRSRFYHNSYYIYLRLYNVYIYYEVRTIKNSARRRRRPGRPVDDYNNNNNKKNQQSVYKSKSDERR